MTKDSFERFPIRTSKGGGTKCTTCEITTECHPVAKCIYPLLCATFHMPSCGYDIILINASTNLGAVRYDCDLQAFDLSFMCHGYVIDLLLTYEEISGQASAVLRSRTLGVTDVIPFTEAINSRCPSWTFDLGHGETVSVRKYELVSIGQQKCVNSGPDDCTAGRCLPKNLCADIYSVDRPDRPYKTTLTWHTNNVVTVPSNCCCNANEMPEILIARVVNYASGCSCMAPARLGSVFWPPEHEGNQITDPGALIHLRHRSAYSSDPFVSGYPHIPEGCPVWVSEGELGDLQKLCPAPNQTITPYTHYIYGRMLLWCDITDGTWKVIFEVVDKTAADAAGNTEYLTPYKLTNPYSTVHYLPTTNVLTCNPFCVRASGMVESNHCFDTDNNAGTGLLDIIVSEFQGWVGDNPTDPGNRITLYSELINAFAAVQSVATDCLPKIHLATSDTFKARQDRFSITKVWPAHVFDGCSFEIGTNPPYSYVSRIVVYPESCEGCNQEASPDPYGDITTRCCPNPIPRTLYATAVEESDCPCANGTQVVLTYDAAEEAWIGSATFGSASGCGICTVNMRLACTDLIASAIWQLAWGFGGRVDYLWTPQVPVNDPEFTCNPFYWVTRSVSSNTCCKPSFAASLFHWVITE